MSHAKWLEDIKFNPAGLVAVIAIDVNSRDVLMQAWANREALLKSVAHGEMFYFSRSRQKLWKKGEESGHVQKLRSLYLDCDGDCVLAEVEQIENIACHTGHKTCFYRKLDISENGISWQEQGKALKNPADIYKNQNNLKSEVLTSSNHNHHANQEDKTVLHKLEKIIADRKKHADVENSYSAKLLNSPIDKILKKIGEEATETVIAACNDSKSEIIYESCDLIYHLMVLWAKKDISLTEIEQELARRFSMSGLEEKNLRNK